MSINYLKRKIKEVHTYGYAHVKGKTLTALKEYLYRKEDSNERVLVAGGMPKVIKPSTLYQITLV
jgi:hypothetical protein